MVETLLVIAFSSIGVTATSTVWIRDDDASQKMVVLAGRHV